MGSATLKRSDDGPEIVYQTEDLRRVRQKVNRMRARYCSSAWWGQPYPPGGPERTGMLRCTRCPAWFPPVAARFLQRYPWDPEVRPEVRGQKSEVRDQTALTSDLRPPTSESEFRRWEPLCLDCWYCDAVEFDPAFVMRLPSAIRYDQATRERDLTAHMDGFQCRARRRRYLEGYRQCTVREMVSDEAGTEYEVIPPPAPVEAEE